MKAFEKNIRKVEPYVPGEQPQRKVIKLNTNENPYPPAPGVTKALEEMDTDRFRLYPDPTAAPLVNALADFYHVNPDQVFVGVGSDSLRFLLVKPLLGILLYNGIWPPSKPGLGAPERAFCPL